MKKFSDINLEDTGNLNTETSNIPDYMLYSPEFIGFNDAEYQRKMYESSIFEIINDYTISVLDVGCGRGDFGDFILSKYPQIQYHGIDMNPLMIEVGNTKYLKSYNNFNLICKEFNNLENYNENHDWVFHILNLAIDYGNINDLDYHDYLKMIIEKSLEISTNGVIMFLLNGKTDNDLANNSYKFIDFSILTKYLLKLGYKFAYDNTDFEDVVKLVILKSKI